MAVTKLIVLAAFDRDEEATSFRRSQQVGNDFTSLTQATLATLQEREVVVGRARCAANLRRGPPAAQQRELMAHSHREAEPWHDQCAPPLVR